jgi:membrane protease YdiL (CAAX protease family)
MDEQSRTPEEPNLPRAHFHLTLALICFPPAAIIGGWIMAILDVLRGYSNRAQLVWSRLLVGLVVADALAAASLLWLGGHAEELQSKAELQRSAIGVSFDAGDRAKLREVAPGSPGAIAGLRPGDVIERVGTKGTPTSKDAADAIQTLEPGAPRPLKIDRAGTSLELSVTIEKTSKPGLRGLFEPEPTAEFRVTDEVLITLLPALTLVVVLAALGRRKPSGEGPVWIGFLVALLGSMGASLGVLALARSLQGGVSLGIFLISVVVQTVAMLALTAAARKWLDRSVSAPAPTMTSLRAGMQGLFYMITGAPRLGFLLIIATYFLAPDGVFGDPMVLQLSEAHFGVFGGVLLVAGIAILAPLAEEFLFRGYLLPPLVRQWGELPALASSSLLFALLHLRDGMTTPLMFFYGWIFGWVRLRSGSIAASTALHMTVNSFAIAVILLQGHLPG